MTQLIDMAAGVFRETVSSTLVEYDLCHPDGGLSIRQKADVK
jgi:hypothetical protein